MTKLIIDGALVEDIWLRLSDEESVPEGHVTVSFSRWLAQRDVLIERRRTARSSLGVRLTLDDDPLRLHDDSALFDLIVIESTAPADGRLFSIAARVREHVMYRGELRVVGQIAPDQLAFMRRCGINAYQLDADIDVVQFLSNFQRHYQSGGPHDAMGNGIGEARFGRRASERRDEEGDEYLGAVKTIQAAENARVHCHDD